MEIVKMIDVQEQSIGWAWENRIPLGEITVLGGPPGCGKSTLLCQLCANWSNGYVEGSLKGHEMRSLIVSEEDPLSVLKERISNAGGQSRLISALYTSYTFDTRLNLSELNKFTQMIIDEEIKIVVLDPFISYLDDRMDMRSDRQVRRSLEPLAEMARMYNLAVILVSHLNKNIVYNPLQRLSGSTAIGALPRSVLMSMPDPKAETREHKFILVQIKNSYAPLAKPLRFSTNRVPIYVKEKEQELFIGYEPGSLIDFQGEDDDVDVDQLFSEGSDGRREALNLTIKFIKEQLGSGPVKSKDLLKDAKDAGITIYMLENAAGKLKVKKKKVGGRGGYFEWSL